MPDLLTEITEIVTGLGTTGIADLPAALAARPPMMRNVTGEHWERLQCAYQQGQHEAAFATAWANGRAFYESPDALRGRAPLTVEWKGAHQPPGFEFLPVDLRIDHVYLVSCKYQRQVHGHVEMRWSHGRFSTVEAKIYLGTPHAETPGYFPLMAGSTEPPLPRVGTLRDAGFGLLPTFRRPHFTVTMAGPEQLKALLDALGNAEPNPYHGPRLGGR